MLFINELAEKREEISEKASIKEKLFYSYLVGEGCPPFQFESLTDVGKVCALAFCPEKEELGLEASKASESVSAIINQQRRRSSERADHYTNSLIDLCAFAVHDLEAEKENLWEYCTSHPPRTGFIVLELFGEEVRPIELNEGQEREYGSDLDRVAFLLGSSEDESIDRELLLGALHEAGTLPEYYVVRTGYLRVLKLAPCGQYLHDAKKASFSLASLVEATRSRYRTVAATFAAFPFVVAAISIFLDPSLPFVWASRILSLLASAFLIFLGVVKGVTEDWKWFIEQVQYIGKLLARLRLRIMGIDDQEVDSLMEKYRLDPLASEID